MPRRIWVVGRRVRGRYHAVNAHCCSGVKTPMVVVVPYTSRRRPVVRCVSRPGSLGVSTPKRDRTRGCRKPHDARNSFASRGQRSVRWLSLPRRRAMLRTSTSTTALIDGFPGAARRTAATYVLTNTHRPTPSGRSVQNDRDTDANRISHRREPRRVGGSRARSMLKMWL